MQKQITALTEQVSNTEQEKRDCQILRYCLQCKQGITRIMGGFGFDKLFCSVLCERQYRRQHPGEIEEIEQERTEQAAREQKEREERAARKQKEREEQVAREQKEREEQAAREQKEREEQVAREQKEREEQAAREQKEREEQAAREQKEREEQAAREQKERGVKAVEQQSMWVGVTFFSTYFGFRFFSDFAWYTCLGIAFGIFCVVVLAMLEINDIIDYIKKSSSEK